jgi:hypothetical protein
MLRSTIGEVTISDHQPVLMRFRLEVNLRKKERVKRVPRIKFEKLRLPEFANQYRDRIGKLIEENVDDVNIVNDEMTRWDELTSLVVKAAEDVCATEER